MIKDNTYQSSYLLCIMRDSKKVLLSTCSLNLESKSGDFEGPAAISAS